MDISCNPHSAIAASTVQKALEQLKGSSEPVAAPSVFELSSSFGMFVAGGAECHGVPFYGCDLRQLRLGYFQDK